MKRPFSLAFWLPAALSFGTVGVAATLWSSQSNAPPPELPGVERLRPVGLTGALRRQRREGALLIDLRGGIGRQIATAKHARAQELPALIKRHFAQAKVKDRKFVIVIGNATQVAQADQILTRREGFDVLRYLPGDFLETRTSRFLDTTVPQITPRQLHQSRARFTIVDIQLPHEQAALRLPNSSHLPPYQTLLRGDFSGLPKGRAIALY